MNIRNKQENFISILIKGVDAQRRFFARNARGQDQPQHLEKGSAAAAAAAAAAASRNAAAAAAAAAAVSGLKGSAAAAAAAAAASGNGKNGKQHDSLTQTATATSVRN